MVSLALTAARTQARVPTAAFTPVPGHGLERRCDLLPALFTTVSGQDINILEKICQGEVPQGIHHAILRLLAREDWYFGEIRTVLSTLGHKDAAFGVNAFKALPGWSVRLSKALRPAALAKRSDCKHLHGRLKAHLQALEEGSRPSLLLRGDDIKGIGASCLGLADAETEELVDVHLITIDTKGVEKVFVAAATLESSILQTFDRTDFSKFGVDRLVVVAVPRGALIAVRREFTNIKVPETTRFIASSDRTLPEWSDEPRFGCYNLSVTKSFDSVVMLDGELLPNNRSEQPDARADEAPHEYIVQVPRGPHELTVLDRAHGGGWTVSYRETLQASELRSSENLCRVIRVDTTKSNAIGILEFSAGQTCERTSVRVEDLSIRAANHIKHRLEDEHQRLVEHRRVEASPGHRPTTADRREFVPLQDLARHAGSLVDLKKRFLTMGGTANMHNVRVREDASMVFEALKNLAWRKGVSDLLAIDVRCIESQNSTWSYTLSVYAIPIDALSRKEGLLRGTKLDDVIRVESESVARLDDIYVALEMVLDRSLGIPYVRLLETNLEMVYREHYLLPVASFRPSQESEPTNRGSDIKGGDDRDEDIIVGAIALDRTAKPDICSRLGSSEEAERSAAIAELSRNFHGTRVRRLSRVVGATDRAPQISYAPIRNEVVYSLRSVTSRVAHGWAQKDQLRLVRQHPGVAVVFTGYMRDGRVRYVDAKCLGTTIRNEIWGDVGVMTGPVSGRWRDSLHLQFILGHTWHRIYRLTRSGKTCASARGPVVCKIPPFFGFSVAGGYSFTRSYRRGYPPLWQGVETAAEDLAYIWHRQAFLITASPEVRIRLPQTSVDLSLRLMPLLSLGWVNTSKIPNQIDTFGSRAKTRNTNFDFDIGLMADVGVSFWVRRFFVQPILRLGWNSLWEPKDETYTAFDDRGLFVGGTLRLGGGL